MASLAVVTMETTSCQAPQKKALMLALVERGTIYNKNERDSAVGFPASVNSSSIDGGVASVPWDGTVDGLGIQKVSRVSEIGLFIQMEVTLTNTTQRLPANRF